MTRLVKKYYRGGGLLDTAKMAEDLKSDSLLFKNGKYTNLGKKRLEALDQIQKNQEAGIRYNIDSDAGTFYMTDAQGSLVSEDQAGRGLGLEESPLFKRDKKLISRVLANPVLVKGKEEVKFEPKKEEKAFEVHTMYDPKTGEAYTANTQEDHNRMAEMGYTYEKPEVKAEEVKVKTAAEKTAAKQQPVKAQAKSNTNQTQQPVKTNNTTTTTTTNTTTPKKSTWTLEDSQRVGKDFVNSILSSDKKLSTGFDNDYWNVTKYLNSLDPLEKQKQLSLIFLDEMTDSGKNLDNIGLSQYNKLLEKVKNAKTLNDFKKLNPNGLFDKSGNAIDAKIKSLDVLDLKGGYFIDKVFNKKYNVVATFKNGGKLVPKAQNGLSGIIPKPKLNYKQSTYFFPQGSNIGGSMLEGTYIPKDNIVGPELENNYLGTTNYNLGSTDLDNPWNKPWYKKYLLADYNPKYQTAIPGDQTILDSTAGETFLRGLQKTGDVAKKAYGYASNSPIGIGDIVGGYLAYKAYKEPVAEITPAKMKAGIVPTSNVLAKRKSYTEQGKENISKFKTPSNISDPTLARIIGVMSESQRRKSLSDIAAKEAEFDLAEQARVMEGENLRRQQLAQAENMRIDTEDKNRAIEQQAEQARAEAEVKRITELLNNVGTIANTIQARGQADKAMDRQFAMQLSAQNQQQQYATAKAAYDTALLDYRSAELLANRGDKDAQAQLPYLMERLTLAKNSMPDSKSIAEQMEEMRQFKRGRYPWQV